MIIRFLHTSDWQLGMTRHFLSEGAQERYNQARFDSIRTMGRIAKEEKCQFMVVCGDTFESNLVDRKTVARALEALKEVSIPVYILPGNHDPLNAASVYRTSTFVERKPENVQIIQNSSLILISEGVELVGAPWMSKRPVYNPIVEAINPLTPTENVIRICLGHGAVDVLSPNQESNDIISVSMLGKAIAEGKIHFVGLGDRHSLTKVSDDDRIWYSGTPEPTDFREIKSGFANIVELDNNSIVTKCIKVGQWQFLGHERIDLNNAEDVESLRKSLEGVENKERTIVKLNLVGSLTLTLNTMVNDIVTTAKDVFGAFEVHDDELLMLPDDADFASIGFTGFADETVKRLRKKIAEDGEESIVAREALMLMLRLARSVA